MIHNVVIDFVLKKYLTYLAYKHWVHTYELVWRGIYISEIPVICRLSCGSLQNQCLTICRNCCVHECTVCSRHGCTNTWTDAIYAKSYICVARNGWVLNAIKNSCLVHIQAATLSVCKMILHIITFSFICTTRSLYVAVVGTIGFTVPNFAKMYQCLKN